MVQNGQHIGGVAYVVLGAAVGVAILPWFGPLHLGALVATFGVAIAGYIALQLGGSVLGLQASISWGLPVMIATLTIAALTSLKVTPSAPSIVERRTPTL